MPSERGKRNRRFLPDPFRRLCLKSAGTIIRLLRFGYLRSPRLSSHLLPHINHFDIVVVFVPIVIVVRAEFVLPFLFIAQRRIQTGFKTEDGQQMIYVVRNRCLKRNGFAGFRMGETQAVGVQCLTRAQTLTASFTGSLHGWRGLPYTGS